MESMRRVLLLGFGLAIAAAGCTQSGQSPTPVPIALAPPSTIDKFSGTLNLLGSNYHQFTVAAPGEVDITLTGTTYAPTTDATTGESVPSTKTDPIPPLQIAVGTPAATTIGLQCSVLVFDTQVMLVSAVASTTAQLKGNALAGNYCISVSDPNAALTDSIKYTVNVAHP
jgi:hypothetical protein